MPRFRNRSGVDLRLGRADGPEVKAGDVLQVDGEVLADVGDAIVIGTPKVDEELHPDTGERLGFTGNARAWPKATWDLIPESKSATTSKGE
jgi:hypothetical protein